MAFPTITINEESPFDKNSGEAKDIHISIVTNAIGKNRLTLSLTAESCCFESGEREMVHEFETTTAGELTELVLKITIIGLLERIIYIRLLAEILNADGESDDDKLTIRLNGREEEIPEQPDNPTNPV